MVACSVCTLEYDVSGRTFRDIKAGRVKARCKLHRGRSDPTRVAAYRRFWLERFTMDEINFMATCIAPFPSQRHARSDIGGVLTASGAPPEP